MKKLIKYLLDLALLVFIVFAVVCLYNTKDPETQPRIECPVCKKQVKTFSTHIVECAIDSIRVELHI